MNAAQRKEMDEQLTERLTTRGFRFTPQREQVYAILLDNRDHPTAEEVFIRVKRAMPEISLATVYNCLDALVQCGMVRQVTFDRSAARFCPNMNEHSHFYCDQCGCIFDIQSPGGSQITLPDGFIAGRVDVAVHGRCRKCANDKANTKN